METMSSHSRRRTARIRPPPKRTNPTISAPDESRATAPAASVSRPRVARATFSTIVLSNSQAMSSVISRSAMATPNLRTSPGARVIRSDEVPTAADTLRPDRADAFAPRCRARRLHHPPSEGVEPAPAPGDVQQLDATERLRDSGVDDEVLAHRLEAQHGSQ